MSWGCRVSTLAMEHPRTSSNGYKKIIEHTNEVKQVIGEANGIEKSWRRVVQASPCNIRKQKRASNSSLAGGYHVQWII